MSCYSLNSKYNFGANLTKMINSAHSKRLLIIGNVRETRIKLLESAWDRYIVHVLVFSNGVIYRYVHDIRTRVASIAESVNHAQAFGLSSILR